jgi:ribose transport system ATP-binding protein
MTPADDITLLLHNVTKTYQGQRALDAAALELRRGEVHALLGQNGSGKSTLIKALAGYHRPDPGAEAWAYGKPFELGAAAGADAGRMRFIHQDLGLVEDLDVTENLSLGASYTGRWWLSNRRERAAAKNLLMRFGVNIDVAAPVRSLTAAQRSMLAILRAVRGWDGGDIVLVLDEPTAALPADEVDQLFELIGRIRAHGGSVLYVTHRLSEVFRIADRVTVLRDGRTIATVPTSTLDHDALVELILGRPIDAVYPPPPIARDEVVLEVNGIAGGTVADVSLRVHRGELVGVTGLVGSGFEQLPFLIFGAQERDRGEVRLGGKRLIAGSPKASIAAGLAFAPADRRNLSTMPLWTLAENITLPKLRPHGPARWLRYGAEREDARVWLDRLAVEPADPEKRMTALSGGNQQRAVLARWLRCGASAFVLEDPTIGVDLGAKAAIYRALAAATRKGAGVLMTTSDAEEACAVCDRVLVMRAGRIGAVLEGQQRTPDRLVAELIGGRSSHDEGAHVA